MTLLTAVRYAEITGDDATAASAVSARLEDAEELLEEYLDRPLVEAERTETMRPDRNGWLWPKATPVTSADGYEVDGAGLVGTSPFGPAVGWLDPTTGVSVTYTGGWTSDTLPRCIERDLAYAAYRLIHPPTLGTTDYPEGATSVRLGDAAITFGAGGAGAVGTGDTDAWWSKRTKSYRYSRVDSGPDVAAVYR